jgi:hypothetical protein
MARIWFPTRDELEMIDSSSRYRQFVFFLHGSFRQPQQISLSVGLLQDGGLVLHIT